MPFSNRRYLYSIDNMEDQFAGASADHGQFVYGPITGSNTATTDEGFPFLSDNPDPTREGEAHTHSINETDRVSGSVGTLAESWSGACPVGASTNHAMSSANFPIAAEDLATRESAVPYGALSWDSTLISVPTDVQDIDPASPSDSKKSLETSSVPVPVLSVLDADEFEQLGLGDSLPTPPDPTPVGSFHINLIFNASVNAAPAGFVQAVQNAAAQVESLFSDSITINVTVGWGEIGGQVITRSHVAVPRAAISTPMPRPFRC
jgi:hypothetical protein